LESATFQGWKRDNKSFPDQWMPLDIAKENKSVGNKDQSVVFELFLIPVALSILGLVMMDSPLVVCTYRTGQEP